MDIKALHRQGYTYAEIGRMVGRDWRTVKRYLSTRAQPAYRRKRTPSKLDPFKLTIETWLEKEPRLLATRIHQDMVRDYGFSGGYQIVRRYVEEIRPAKLPPQLAEERFETAPGHTRHRWIGPTRSPSSPQRDSPCRSTASTWCSPTRVTPSAASSARWIWLPSGRATGPPSPTSEGSRARYSTIAPKPS
jgi:transposase